MWLDQAIVTSATISNTKNHANYTTIYAMESKIELTDSMLSSNIGSLYAIESSLVLADVAVETDLVKVVLLISLLPRINFGRFRLGRYRNDYFFMCGN